MPNHDEFEFNNTKVEITFDEWIAEFEKVSKANNDKGLTLEEIVAEMQRRNIGKKTTISSLYRLKAQNRLIVGRRAAVRLDNRNYSVPVYHIKGAANAEAAVQKITTAATKQKKGNSVGKNKRPTVDANTER